MELVRWSRAARSTRTRRQSINQHGGGKAAGLTGSDGTSQLRQEALLEDKDNPATLSMSLPGRGDTTLPSSNPPRAFIPGHRPDRRARIYQTSMPT